MRLENWFWNNGSITGNVYGNPKFKDGDLVTTSQVAYEADGVIHTTTGSKYILGSPIKRESDFEDLVKKVEVWAEDRGIFANSTPKDQALKTGEELGELFADIAKGRDVRDSIGDVLVTLILQCKLQNTTVKECLEIAYSEISTRKGRIIDGVFIKEDDITK